MATIKIKRVQHGFGFEAVDEKGHMMRFDTKPEVGGEDFGSRPMESLLMGLGSCSGIDIISILNKQRQATIGFAMTITGEREQNKVPSLWKTVHIDYHLSGEIDEAKARHAIELSVDKYCSVAETLRRAGCTITWKLKVN